MIDQKESKDILEARTAGGLTPLHFAIQGGNIYLIQECLNQGMHPFAEDYLGQSAVDYANQGGGGNRINIVHLI